MNIKLIIGLCIIFSLFGCDNKLNSKSLTNNYIFYIEPDMLPYSKLIKTQTIKGSEQKEFEFDDNGYVTNLSLRNLQVLVDYQTKKYVYIRNGEKLEYDLILDEANNILTIKDSGDKDIITSTFDPAGRIIEVDYLEMNDSNIRSINRVFYDNDLVNKTSYEVFMLIDKTIEVPFYLKEKQYIYNNKKQLIQSIEQTFRPETGKYLLDANNQKIPEQQDECFYSDHNEHGDWTKLYCLNAEKETTRFNLRTLEYY